MSDFCQTVVKLTWDSLFKMAIMVEITGLLPDPNNPLSLIESPYSYGAIQSQGLEESQVRVSRQPREVRKVEVVNRDLHPLIQAVGRSLLRLHRLAADII